MFRKYSSLALALMLCCVMPVAAQSGRVRQLSYAERIRADASRPLSDNATDSTSRIKTSSTAKSSLTTNNSQSGRLSPLVYNNNTPNQANQSDGDYHMTKGDRIAGYIILGYVIVTGIVWIIHDGDF